MVLVNSQAHFATHFMTCAGPLGDPSKLELTVDSNNRHFFRWISPRVPQDVILSCYVTAVNLSSGNTLKNISTTEQYVSVLNSSGLSVARSCCQCSVQMKRMIELGAMSALRWKTFRCVSALYA